MPIKIFEGLLSQEETRRALHADVKGGERRATRSKQRVRRRIQTAKETNAMLRSTKHQGAWDKEQQAKEQEEMAMIRAEMRRGGRLPVLERPGKRGATLSSGAKEKPAAWF